MNLSVLLRVFALVCFILAVLVGFGTGSVDHSAALIPAGLAFWVGSTLS